MDLLSRVPTKNYDSKKISFKTIAGSKDEAIDLTKEEFEKYEEFCKIVANSRNLDLNDHLNWANGREIPARKALEFNLIDEIGDLDTALNKVKELLNNDHKNINKKTNYKLRMIDACSEKKNDEPNKNEANLSSSFKL